MRIYDLKYNIQVNLCGNSDPIVFPSVQRLSLFNPFEHLHYPKSLFSSDHSLHSSVGLFS